MTDHRPRRSGRRPAIGVGRRAVLGSAASALLAGMLPSIADGSPDAARLKFGPEIPFGFDDLVERARRQANAPYAPPRQHAADLVDRITYEVLSKIRFRPDSALFRDDSGVYPVGFFHLGRFSPTPVKMFAVSGPTAREIRYLPAYFDMPKDSIARPLPPDAGFAGFRLHESRYRNDWRTQDWTAFLGASYFRAIGALGQYGLSARGIAVDTAMPTPEEFPTFIEFYIGPAAAGGDPVIVHALLDGPRVAGAYRFAIWRTAGVVMEVDARMFLRGDIGRLGIAPLTSMFAFAEYGHRSFHDWRPEIHDSDGLAMWTGKGERIWRPLNNPPAVTTSAFLDSNPRGFGLLQRDRNFEHYLDGVHYDRRPSLWVEPLGDWGAGAIQCVEIPTDDEIHDNIVAFWTPAKQARRGDGLAFRYRLHWLADQPYPVAHIAHTVATRTGRGGEPGKPRPEGVHKFVVEFAGGQLAALGAATKPEAVITTTRGKMSYEFVEQIPGTNRWRCQFDLAVAGKEPIEIRLYLRLGERAASETWLYQFHPPA